MLNLFSHEKKGRKGKVKAMIADPVYSQPLNVSGLSWRLKVYPVRI
jgi:hypothetical protein